MTVILCPGVHSPVLTESFIKELDGHLADYLVLPNETVPPYSALHVLDFLHRQFAVPHSKTCWHLPIPLLFVGFSAGVVGAIGAAWAWQSMGRTVKALIAFDGWGMPLYGNFPIHRVSHDAFTHRSSNLWQQEDSFYADPAVAHLDLWRSPPTAQGWHISPSSFPCLATERRTATTAAKFLLLLLARYEEIAPASVNRLP